MNKDEFFHVLKPWSERKHRLLSKYLKPFSAKVATLTQNREIYCVDGFAGAAKYDDGKEGSPLLLAKLSDDCAKWQNPVSLKIINSEPNDENFHSLDKLTKEWVQKGKVKNLRNKFSESVAEILLIIGNAPALFFIDPCGPTKIPLRDISSILRRNVGVTELIINFDTDGLQRIAEASFTSSTDSKIIKSAETNLRNVSEILGTEEWIEKYDLGLSTQQKQELLLSIYIEQLRRFGYYVVAYGIREGLRKPIKYHLIYCTKHRDGIFLMNDFIVEEENMMLQSHFTDDMPLLENLLENESDDRRKCLESLVREFLEKHSKTTREQIKQTLVFEHFAEFHNKDYNGVVKALLNNEELVASHGKKRINDQEPLTYHPKRSN